MKVRAPYVATCFVGVVIGMVLQSLLTSRRASAPQNAASAASFIVAQSWLGNPRVAATQSGPPARVILSGTNLPYVVNSAPRQPNLPFISNPPERDRTVLLKALTPAEIEKLEKALKSIAPKPSIVDNGSSTTAYFRRICRA